MKMWKDLSREEKGDLLLAHQEGKTIQCFIVGWSDMTSNPTWLSHAFYRIKPEEDDRPKTLDQILEEEVAWMRLIVDNEPRLYKTEFKDGAISIECKQKGTICPSTLIELYCEDGTFLLSVNAGIYSRFVLDGDPITVNEIKTHMRVV